MFVRLHNHNDEEIWLNLALVRWIEPADPARQAAKAVINFSDNQAVWVKETIEEIREKKNQQELMQEMKQR